MLSKWCAVCAASAVRHIPLDLWEFCKLTYGLDSLSGTYLKLKSRWCLSMLAYIAQPREQISYPDQKFGRLASWYLQTVKLIVAQWYVHAYPYGCDSLGRKQKCLKFNVYESLEPELLIFPTHISECAFSLKVFVFGTDGGRCVQASTFQADQILLKTSP